MEVKNINDQPTHKNIVFSDNFEDADKVKIWLIFKEALSCLLNDKIISSDEWFSMTISIRKRLGLFVIE